MSHSFAWLSLLAPLIAALFVALPHGYIGRKVYNIGVLLHVVAFAAACCTFYVVAGHDHEPIRLSFFSWGGALPLSFVIDRLAAVMMVVITCVGALIYRYSMRYMQSEDSRPRFHALLSVAVVTLICMVSSNNLLTLFLFWQLVSWLLGFLPYNYSHIPTVKGAFRTTIILRLGDLAFLLGVALAYRHYGTLDLELLFSRAKASEVMLSVAGLHIRAVTAITLLIFVGAMTKSAQFPFHSWLPDFLYAPTPVCGFLHAGIVNAGGFLLNRLAPLYGLSTPALHIVFAVGVVTTFLGASMMLTQNDIKKTLGYSTVGQMGYMIMECGLGAFSLAIFHLIAHGVFKATIFLNSGHVIHAARLDPRLPSKDEEEEQATFSLLAWLVGFGTTLVLPLTILLALHGMLSIPLSQGTVLFLFFSWFTSSQAILTLYRLKAVASSRIAALMLLTLLLVVSTYLLAAEVFTGFLYPTPGEVAYYFKAAGLPDWLFDSIIVVTSLFVIMGWILIYARSHGRSIRARGRVAQWIGVVQLQLYLFFMNRLYLESAWLRVERRFKRLVRRADRSPLVPIALFVIAIALPLRGVLRAGGFTLRSLAFSGLLLLSMLLLPLFPLHGLYVMALTRLRGLYPLIVALLMPIAGLVALHYALPEIPRGLFGTLRVLAFFGGLYGSFKALTQTKTTQLVTYASFALYSMLWWQLSIVGKVTPQAAIYTASLGLVGIGLLHAFDRVKQRYGPLNGELSIDRVSGLVRAMPRFAILFSLLVMAAAGLPPFGPFSGFAALLLRASDVAHFSMFADLLVVLLVWFAASYYLVRMMQRFLFGQHRQDIPHEDLNGAEIAPFAIVLVLLVILGAVPLGLYVSDVLASSYHLAMR